MEFNNKGWIVRREKPTSLQRYSTQTSAGVAAATRDRRLPFNRSLDSATLEHLSPVSGNYAQCVRGTGIGDLMYTNLSVSLGTFSSTSTGRGFFSDREPARAARGRIASARMQPDGLAPKAHGKVITLAQGQNTTRQDTTLSGQPPGCWKKRWSGPG
jgi:hypothetical protein